MISLTVVTPWHNHRELEGHYWKAIRDCEQVQVIVVDNGSDPRLPNAWRLPENRGFSHASNIGLELARTDAVVFLNNDIMSTRPGWDMKIREALEPGVLVGAQMRTDPHGNLNGTALPYLDGWCLAGMREDLNHLGGFDESYQEPAYFSDNDLCIRARADGITLREAKTGLVHLKNVTAGPYTDTRVQAATAANQARFRQVATRFLEVTV